MTGRWIFASRLPLLYHGDMIRDRRTYEGENNEILPGDKFDHDNRDLLEMWYIADIARNGWITLERNVRRPHSHWQETGEIRKVRGRKAINQMIVGLHPTDDRWDATHAV